ncbi:DNA-binding transcriptional LysR family regulator [Rhizobium sp. SG_E_25_P2]|uniref:LysR family transcriptional regulator n=1 Tax=Rhizobium sp. SG_E_25_P2 TaxID=2879942 RepID=UPI0024748A52|nr:LysR family transcriptional regulator [Rhizobium sp. SG_E_25_P2]MDH6264724.1 DNA-binding transcriptional LysR family regulator [Rhizobium sp. SG_E_25_P2]
MTNLGDLEIFTRVVASGSMSEAARELGLQTPVISKRIKRLEERLGSRLFHRTTRQISLTEAGEGFHERVLAALAGLEEAEAFLAGRSSAVTGRLRVSAPTSFGRMHIAPYLTRFFSLYPDVELQLTLTDAFQDLVAEGFDLAIRIGELPSSSLVARKLAAVRRILCATPDYVERHGTPAAIEDLEQHVCIPAHNNAYWHLSGPNGPVALRPVGPLSTNSSEVVREAVLSGLGIAFRSTWDVGPDVRAGRLVQVLPDWEGSSDVGLYAVYPSRQHLPAKVRAFIDFLADLYGPQPYWDKSSL